MKLSPQQLKVYDFVDKYHVENGISPSRAEIAKALGLAISTVSTYIDCMVKKGRISAMPGIPRSIKVIPEINCNN